MDKGAGGMARRCLSAQGVAMARARPQELAETLCAVHEAASERYGQLQAQHEFGRLNGGSASTKGAPSYARTQALMKQMVEEAVHGLSRQAAACFLVHEACRAAHRFVGCKRPAVYDVQEFLLTEAEARMDLPTEAIEAWFDSPTTPPPCSLLRDAAGEEWPVGIYDAP